MRENCKDSSLRSKVRPDRCGLHEHASLSSKVRPDHCGLNTLQLLYFFLFSALNSPVFFKQGVNGVLCVCPALKGLNLTGAHLSLSYTSLEDYSACSKPGI
ncbi:hypothetical protein NQD34_016609 [Periophthalmus magnuspinnatus]|nr:hypothetical protein NQD34_016609 [Periophthalmus magnuspinnatus]